MREEGRRRHHCKIIWMNERKKANEQKYLEGLRKREKERVPTVDGSDRVDIPS
jgi:hypothetical protein